jgi:deoxyadenosine/deoxycytidine kinase
MKTIILEGSTASGKTTTAKLLADILIKKNKTVLVVSENKTLMPILSNRDRKISLDHLKKIIMSALDKPTEYLIFDRLHLTASAITSSSISEYQEIEKQLLLHNPLLILLTINEDEIPQRIRESIKYRGPSWERYVNKKGNELQINVHYIEAQKKVLKQYQDSLLPKIEFDTTGKNFDLIAQKIAGKILK